MGVGRLYILGKGSSLHQSLRRCRELDLGAAALDFVKNSRGGVACKATAIRLPSLRDTSCLNVMSSPAMFRRYFNLFDLEARPTRIASSSTAFKP